MLSEKAMFAIKGGIVGGDNCFTWARKKLKLLGIKLPNKPFECLSVRTKEYTKKPNAFKKLSNSCAHPLDV